MNDSWKNRMQAEIDEWQADFQRTQADAKDAWDNATSKQWSTRRSEVDDHWNRFADGVDDAGEDARKSFENFWQGVKSEWNTFKSKV